MYQYQQMRYGFGRDPADSASVSDDTILHLSRVEYNQFGAQGIKEGIADVYFYKKGATSIYPPFHDIAVGWLTF